MLCFLVRGQHTYTITIFQQHTQADFIRVIPYEDLDNVIFGSEDLVIFCDIDRCHQTQREELIGHYKKLRKLGCRILNNPEKVRGRYDLLRGLHTHKMNHFQVYRLDDLSPGHTPRFPVFVRNELEHDGPATDLIRDNTDLSNTLAKLETPNPLICEFIDTAVNGYFHKYGAFILSGNIIPRHFFLSPSWNVKNASGGATASTQLERDYVLQNPHVEELRRIADFANIEYGRIDYAITEEGIQVFEINTNPTLIDHQDIAESNPRHFITDLFIKTFLEELKHLSRRQTHD